MIGIQMDLTKATAAELLALFKIPGLKSALVALSLRGRRLDLALTINGQDGAVSSLRADIAGTLPTASVHAGTCKSDYLGLAPSPAATDGEAM